MLIQVGQVIDQVLRVLLLVALGTAVTVALTSWAVRRGLLEAFGTWSRWVRRWSDPLLAPVERQLVRQGRNPQEGPIWFLGVVAVSGILVLNLTRWLVGTIATIATLSQAGPLPVLAFLANLLYSALLMALLVRVIGSWVGGTRWTAVIRWAYTLTDWVVLPIQKRLPPFGPFDVSPILAYFVLLILRSLVLGLL
ncbi:MAG: YggT family protein [Gemmatimonadales bacterium]|nr:MAG: YggT family protein [Gemmatimonadales bacterium]